MLLLGIMSLRMKVLVVFAVAPLAQSRLFGSQGVVKTLMNDAPRDVENVTASFLGWLNGQVPAQTPPVQARVPAMQAPAMPVTVAPKALGNQTAGQSFPQPGHSDGYLDTAKGAPRNVPPREDPVGDHEGWGPDAKDRETSPNADMGETSHGFSILDAILGPHQRSHPWSSHCTMGVVVSAMLMAWTFKNLKVISDVYFVPAVCALGKRLGMSNDVAGATLLAFGSSAPEFCTNVVASFFITNECGVGDIVGSAIHNILLIIGVSAVFAGRMLNLWWYPLTRDSVFFLVSVVELAAFLWDEHLQIWEASVMVATYGLYITWMVWNIPIYNNICSMLKVSNEVPEDGDDDDDEDGDGVLYYDPIEIFWRHSMPSYKSSSVSCFLLALAHIAWNSYIMVDAATRFGVIFNIPSLFMGLVFLAAGTSIPDAFASMAAARKGEGDMAVSNALGSNIFDITVGLGLPWLVSLLMGKPIVFLGVNRLLYWVFGMIGVLGAFLGAVVAGRWTLSYRVGCALCGMYVGYICWAMVKAI